MTRGVLCVPCNSGLGSFQDDVFRLEHAREYVANWAESDIVPFTMEYTDLEVK
jgi:hypothetical protein